MDGLTATLARIDQIQARIASLAPVAPRPQGPSFAEQLAAASGAGAARGSAEPGPTASAGWQRMTAAGGRDRGWLTLDGVPVELAKYGNGKIPASALSTIGHGSHRMWAPAAEAFKAMEAAAARDGIKIGVTDSYRSYEAQVDVARRKGLYSEGGLAAKPGTSDHGYGRSLDLDLNSKAQAWMSANAGRYGFVEDTPREPWHWTFTPVR